MSTFELLVSDVAGTVVTDDGVVMSAFSDAFEQIVPERWSTEKDYFRSYAQETMGQSKGDVFRALLDDADLAHRANELFDLSYRERLPAIEPISGAEGLFHRLHERNMKVALNTGFTRTTLDALLSQLGWEGLVDFSVTPSEAGAGRPSPAMIVESMNQAGVGNSEAVVVVGDTISDVQAGRAAGAGMVIAVLTGAHSRTTLEAAGPDAVISSIAELDSLLD